MLDCVLSLLFYKERLILQFPFPSFPGIWLGIPFYSTQAKYAVFYGEGRDIYDEWGRVAHESIFNTNDGKYRCPNSQQGFSGFTNEERHHLLEETLLHHLGKTAEILFFLLGAMTLVELVDAHHGFHFVSRLIKTNQPAKLMWIVGFITFFLSAILDNLTKSDKRVKPNQIRALILTPTRELASQIADNISGYGKELGLRHGVIFGGVAIGPQIRTMSQGLDILIATPGRLIPFFDFKIPP